MSIYSEIDRLELAKQNLKLKLESKGVTVPADARISDYAALINLLPEIKESEFTNRIVDNGNSGTGKAKIYNIKGRTRIWNQLFSARSSAIVGNFTIVNNGDGSLSISGTNTSNTSVFISVGQILSNIPIGHKFLVVGTPVGGETTERMYSSVVSYAFWMQIANASGTEPTCPVGGHIITANSVYARDTINYQPNIVIGAGQTINLTLRPQIFDLTKMFGAGYEPTTVEEFKAMFPDDYYPYNEGTPINNDAEAVESTGFNQWDEEWESGVYDINSGVKVGNAQYIRCKNLISVFPNITYYKRAGAGANDFSLCFYDNNKQFIRGTQPGINVEFVTPDNCHYISFYINTGTPSTYNNDICINISNPAKNGTYKPYKKDTCNLGLNSFRVKDSEDNIITVNGLKSAGNVYDEITDKYINRIGEVDLGSLNYTKTMLDEQDCFEVYCITFSQGLPKYGGYILSPIYSANNVLKADKTVAVSRGSNVPAQYRWFFRNDAYVTAADFKTAMSGVKLYYEKATPIEYELVDEIDTIYDVDKDGVERVISPVHADGSPSVPFRASIGYPVNQEQ